MKTAIFKILFPITLVLITLPSCTTSQNTKDYSLTVSILVTKEGKYPDDYYTLQAQMQYADGTIPMAPLLGVESNTWGEVQLYDDDASNYEIKLLLDGEVITTTLHGIGNVLKFKVAPYPDSDKVKVKGFFLAYYRIFPINTDCILNQKTVIFKERKKDLQQAKITAELLAILIHRKGTHSLSLS
jgi:hypothetical protein